MSLTLSVQGPAGEGSCTGSVFVLGSVLPLGFGAGEFGSLVASSSPVSKVVNTAVVTTSSPMAQDPTGIISVSSCAEPRGGGCPIMVNWISHNSTRNGSSEIKLLLTSLSGEPMGFDAQGNLADGVPKFVSVASANGSKTFFLILDTSVKVSLYRYKSDGTEVLLQKQVVSVHRPLRDYSGYSNYNGGSEGGGTGSSASDSASDGPSASGDMSAY